MDFFIDTMSEIVNSENIMALNQNKNVALSVKVAKSMLAMAMISQLIPYYGGEITDNEWSNGNMNKYCISKEKNKIRLLSLNISYEYIAFHTIEQRDTFLKYNKQLVKDYLMID